jgi:hypothetical protein
MAPPDRAEVPPIQRDHERGARLFRQGRPRGIGRARLEIAVSPYQFGHSPECSFRRLDEFQ